MKKKWNVQDIIEEIDNEELILYVGNDVNMDDEADKRIVLFTHELKRSGAPSVLFDMSKVFLEWGYSVFLIADEDGELLEEYVIQGVNVVIYTKLTTDNNWLIKIAEIFPRILVNTMALICIVDFLVPYARKLYWWIHEAEVGIANWADIFRDIQKGESLTIWAASPLIKDNIRDYWKWEAELLNFYIDDVPEKETYAREKIHIINVGDMNGNKGQDILVSAFEKLEPKTKDKCELFFCGYNQRYNEELILKILKYIDMKKNVHLLEGMPKEELYDVYDAMDIVVVASYYESTSAVAVEGLMKRKLCICTETCGVCRYLKDGESALMFERGNAVSLAKALEKAIEKYDELEYIRNNGRIVYQKTYAKDIFEKRLSQLLEK